jgi:hypothetical protein
MGNLSCSTDQDGNFDIKAEMSAESLLYIQSQRKRMNRAEKDLLDKSIREHVLNNINKHGMIVEHNSLHVSEDEAE